MNQTDVFEYAKSLFNQGFDSNTVLLMTEDLFSSDVSIEQITQLVNKANTTQKAI